MKLNFRHSGFCNFLVSIFLLAAFALSSVSNSHAFMHDAHGEKFAIKSLSPLGTESAHGQHRHLNVDHANINSHHSSNDTQENGADCCSANCVNAIIVNDSSKIKLEVAKMEIYWRSLQIVRSEPTELHRPPNS